MVKFIYYLAAIGEQDLEVKKDILYYNLNYIYNQLNENFDIMINCYEEEYDVKKIIDTNMFPYINNIYFHCKKGMLFELWYTNPYHDELKKYDFIFFILDDVKIKFLDMKEFIYVKNTFNVELLSPRVEDCVWDYMHYEIGNRLAFTNRLEIFCLLLTYDDFIKYLFINDIDNSYIWGVDLLMAHFDIQSAIFYKFTVIHKLPGGKHGQKAGEAMNKYLKKHGYENLEEVISRYPEPMKKIIYL